MSGRQSLQYWDGQEPIRSGVRGDLAGGASLACFALAFALCSFAIYTLHIAWTSRPGAVGDYQAQAADLAACGGMLLFPLGILFGLVGRFGRYVSVCSGLGLLLNGAAVIVVVIGYAVRAA